MQGLQLIGKGSFTKAYLNVEDNRVYLDSNDPIKEVMALGWFPESSLFPKITLEKTGYYSMEYYPKVRSLKQNLDADQYAIYNLLRTFHCSFTGRNKYDAYQFYYEAFGTIQDEELRETMQEALDACGNFGTDIGFEISPRNVATKEGKLILLDCFFNCTHLDKTRGR